MEPVVPEASEWALRAVRMRVLTILATQYNDTMSVARAARTELRMEVRIAKQAGHTFREIADATGLSISVIQRMVK